MTGIVFTRSLYVVCAVLCLSATLSWPAPLSAQNSELPFGLLESYEAERRATADLLERATVWVIADGRREISSGSGFMVAPGYVLTNAHVVSGEENMKYYIMNEFLPLTKAVLIDQEYDRRSESGNDFALLAFNLPEGIRLPVLSFNLEVKRMDRVSAWGYPDMITRWDRSVRNMRTNINNIEFAPPVVYTEGTVSTLVSHRGSSIIHTAAIAAGNSGGPLVNYRGEVVGVNTWGYTEAGEGAFVNAALTATEIVSFLRKNGIEPRLADGSGAVAWEQDQAAANQADGQPASIAPLIPEPAIGDRDLWLEIALYTGGSGFEPFFSQAEAEAQSPGQPEPEPITAPETADPPAPNQPEQPKQPKQPEQTEQTRDPSFFRPGKAGDRVPEPEALAFERIIDLPKHGQSGKIIFAGQ